MRAVVVVLLSLSASVAHAEVAEKGFRVGGHLLVLQDNDNNSSNPGSNAVNGTPGFAIAGYVDWRLSDALSVMTEIQIADAPFFEEHCQPSCETLSTLSLWFLELPLGLRFDLIPGDRTKFHIDFGPEVIVAMGGLQKSQTGGADTALDLNPGNFGGFVGIGFGIPAGPGAVTFDVRYQRWIGPLVSSDGVGMSVKSSHQFFASIGYAFH